MELLAGLFLVLITGFYSGSETALYRANWVRLNHWVKKRLPGARDALRALEKMEPTLITTIIGTNLASVFATILIQRYFVAHFGGAATPVAVTLTVVVTLVLGDYLPKALAQTAPNRWLRRGGFLLNASRLVFAPLTALIARITPRPARTHLSREELGKIIARRSPRAATSHRPLTATMVARLLRFSTMRVAEAAIPLKRVRSVSVRDSAPDEVDPAAVLAVLKESGYSRIPVYQGTSDNIIGLVVAKDLLTAPPTKIRPIRLVQTDARALEILRQMQQRGEQLSLVVDHQGRTTGIITLEDLLEEMVGEIRSED